MKHFSRAMWILSVSLVFAFSGHAMAKKLHVGIYDNPPLVSVDSKGNPQGVFIDFLEDVASRESWDLEYHHFDFSEALDALEKGDLDLIPAVAVSYERLKRFSFTRKSVLENWALFYRHEGFVLNNLFDLEGAVIAGVAGDIHLQAMRELLQRYEIKAEIKEVSSYDEAMKALDNRECQAALVNRTYSTRRGGQFSSVSTMLVFNPIALHFVAQKHAAYDVVHALDRELAMQLNDPASPLQNSMDFWLRPEKVFEIPAWVLVAALILFIIIVGLLLFNRILHRLVRQRTIDLQMEKDRSEQAFRSQNLFLGTLSHELRTPLNYISGSICAMREEYGDQPEAAELIETMGQGLYRLEHLMASLLRFAHIEREDFSLQVDFVDIGSLFEEVFETAKILPRKTTVELYKSFYIEDKLVLRTDEDALFQVSLNLLHNALKYTQEGRVDFRVRTVRLDDSVQLTITVEDTGPGIPLEDQREILLPFRRGSSTNFVESGTGLGLSIVTRFTKLLEGELRISSQEGSGSRFTVEVNIPAGSGSVETA